MIKRVSFALLFVLALILSAQTASACAVCKYAGVICNANGCDLVEVCSSPNYPKRGYADCYFIGSTCINSGELCVWASLIQPAQPEQPEHEKAS
jgi:hypothetical protein